TIIIILAGGALVALLWKPVTRSFQDTFKTEESRRAERMAERAKRDSLSNESSAAGETSGDSAIARSSTQPSPVAPAEPEITHLFSSEAFMDSVQAQLQNLPQFRGKELMFHGDIHFYTYRSGRLQLEIQDPDVPENLDK